MNDNIERMRANVAKLTGDNTLVESLMQDIANEIFAASMDSDLRQSWVDFWTSTN